MNNIFKRLNPFKHPSLGEGLGGLNKQELRNLSAMFAILDAFEKKGVLYWQRKEKCLLIEEALAVLKLKEGAEGFRNFLNQVALWQNHRLIGEAYEAHRIDTEAKAVREAKKKYAHLTNADIQRIRQNAREQMPEIAPDKLDYIKEFDLYIIRATAPSQAEATEAAGQLVALGHWDGEKLEMAMYEDIKNNL